MNTIPEPHAVAPDGRVMATRVCRLGGDLLRSPHRHTPWESAVMTTDSWTDSAAVLGECGLHAVCYTPHAVPGNRGEAIVHVICSGKRAVFARRLRCEFMEIDRIVLHPADASAAAALRARYGVPVDVAPMLPRDGECESLDADGAVTIERFQAGRLHGIRDVLYADGTRVISEYCNGDLHGYEEIRIGMGRVTAHYRDGQLHGQYEAVYDDGTKVVSHYRAGKLHGRREETRADGTKVVSHYRDDRRHGAWELVCADGTRFIAEYRHGLLHGQRKEIRADESRTT